MKKSTAYFVLFLLIMVGINFIACTSDDETEIPITVTTIKIEPDSVNIKVGESIKLTVRINGKVVDNTDLIWSSNSLSCFNIDNNGVLTGIGESTFDPDLIVEATYRKDNSIRAVCKVNVIATYTYFYRLKLTDKGDVGAIDPTTFLSEEAIARRNKYHIKIDEKDYPISPDYLRKITDLGGIITVKSKWLNTVTIAFDGDISKYKELSFVEDIMLVEKIKSNSLNFRNNEYTELENLLAVNNNIYGQAIDNIEIHNGQVLHEKGFKGNGMNIGIIDGGFYNINVNRMFSNSQIKNRKAFIYNFHEYSNNTHGAYVFSCMGTNKSGSYVGTAPQAPYYLMSSEIIEIEQPIEEDNWVAALEYADSIGVQVVNTSLAYKNYDSEFASYTFDQIDGKTAFITQAANIGADKGILIVCGAGNDNSGIGVLADSPKVLTVGGVYKDKEIGRYTNYGMTADGRIKPDVVSLSMSAIVVDEEGYIRSGNGTSFASPILCGLAACLWQAYPDLSNIDIITILKQAGDKSDNPELPYGYGLPDMAKAMRLAEQKSNFRR